MTATEYTKNKAKCLAVVDVSCHLEHYTGTISLQTEKKSDTSIYKK